ncbi:putative K domain-like, alpha/beta, P-loop containing nucleoside triphosphate hydrolase [Helianthus debilis subsp. tardiflorus]
MMSSWGGIMTCTFEVANHVLDSAGLEVEASSGSVLGRNAEMTANVLRKWTGCNPGICLLLINLVECNSAGRACFVGPEAGLTRDSVRVEYKFEGRTIYMVDTTSWLQRTKSEKGASSLSIVQSRKNLMRAHVAASVLDGQEVSKARKSLTHDVVIVKRAIEEGWGLVVVLNKMDLVEERLYDLVVKAVPQEIDTIIPLVTGIPVVFVSALERKGRIDVMQQVMSSHSWKDVEGQPKVKYFTQVKVCRPTFVAFVSGKTRLLDIVLKFLTRSLKEDFDMMGGIPVRILH